MIPLQMTIVIVPKFNFVQMLNSIQKYSIGHLMYVYLVCFNVS